MSMFYVGQRVVCVSSAPFVPFGCTSVYVGNVYTIRRVAETYGGLGIWVEEISNPSAPCGEEWGFFAHRFRPVKDTSIEIFRKLLAPIPEKEDA